MTSNTISIIAGLPTPMLLGLILVILYLVLGWMLAIGFYLVCLMSLWILLKSSWHGGKSPGPTRKNEPSITQLGTPLGGGVGELGVADKQDLTTLLGK
jgi:hypothetical protein